MEVQLYPKKDRKSLSIDDGGGGGDVVVVVPCPVLFESDDEQPSLSLGLSDDRQQKDNFSKKSSKLEQTENDT